MAEPLVYCVRCGQYVRADRTGEGQHSKLDADGNVVPCR